MIRPAVSAAVAAIVLLAGACSAGTGDAPSDQIVQTRDRIPSVAEASAPIPDTPVLDARSGQIVAALGAGDKVIDIFEYGVSVVTASTSTPRFALPVHPPENWGTSPFADPTVPLERAWPVQSLDADGALVIEDTDGMMIGLYGLDLAAAAPNAVWGEVSDPNGSMRPLAGKATGSGIPRWFGLIREEEWATGSIEHPLVFSTDMAAAGSFRPPAWDSDGANLRGGSVMIEQGARLQLDPSFDVDGADMAPYEKMVARALQVYGAYAIDNGGAAVAVIAERPRAARSKQQLNSAGIASVGIGYDYPRLDALPWDQMRVLAHWDGGTAP